MDNGSNKDRLKEEIDRQTKILKESKAYQKNVQDLDNLKKSNFLKSKDTFNFVFLIKLYSKNNAIWEMHVTFLDIVVIFFKDGGSGKSRTSCLVLTCIYKTGLIHKNQFLNIPLTQQKLYYSYLKFEKSNVFVWLLPLYENKWRLNKMVYTYIENVALKWFNNWYNYISICTLTAILKLNYRNHMLVTTQVHNCKIF